jgi:hypothetical protein
MAFYLLSLGCGIAFGLFRFRPSARCLRPGYKDSATPTTTGSDRRIQRKNDVGKPIYE